MCPRGDLLCPITQCTNAPELPGRFALGGPGGCPVGMNEGSPPMQQRPSSIPLSLQRETEFQKKLPLESNKLIKACKRGREGERWRYDPLGGLAGLSLTRALWLKEKNYFNPHFSHLARTPLTCLGAEMRPLHQKSVRQVTLAKSSKNWGDAHKGPSSGMQREPQLPVLLKASEKQAIGELTKHTSFHQHGPSITVPSASSSPSSSCPESRLLSHAQTTRTSTMSSLTNSATIQGPCRWQPPPYPSFQPCLKAGTVLGGNHGALPPSLSS